MDLILIVASLAGIGLYLNNTEEPMSDLGSKLPNSRQNQNLHVYEDHNYAQMRREEQIAGEKLFKMSQSPETTGIISPLYNSIPNDNGLIGQSHDRVQETIVAAANEFQETTPTFSNFNPNDADDQVLHDSVSRNNLNQTPFIRGSQPTQNISENVNAGLLERFTGQNADDGTTGMYRPKTERKSFGIKSKNEHVLAGAGLSQDTIDRSREMASEKRQGQPLMAPIYVSQNTRGYVPPERPVSELRSRAPDRQKLNVKYNQGNLGAGSLVGSAPPRPKFQQNHTPREAQLGDVLVPRGISKDAQRPLVLLPQTIRSISDTTGKKYIRPGQSPIEIQASNPSDKYKRVLRNTIRNQTGKTSYLSQGQNAVPIGYTDSNIDSQQKLLHPTGREQVGHIDYQGAGTAPIQEPTEYNLTNERVTMRETTVAEYTPVGQSNTTVQGGYSIANQNARITARETTLAEYTPNAGNGGVYEQRDYKSQYFSNSLKALTSINDYIPRGGIVQIETPHSEARDQSLRGNQSQIGATPGFANINSYLQNVNAHIAPRTKEVSIDRNSMVATELAHQLRDNPYSQFNTIPFSGASLN